MMSDEIRKTVVEKPKDDRTRTTIVEGPSGGGRSPGETRQTALETSSEPSNTTARHTVIESDSGHAPSAIRQIDMEQSTGVTALAGKGPMLFRSLVRPPMAIVTALDDGSPAHGETFRIRRERTTIGRTACDITIPHDPDLSATHGEIVRHEKDGGHQWQLVDLKSTNGTFVRTTRMVLRNGRELLLGGRRFVFSCPNIIASDVAEDANESRATHKQAPPLAGQFRKLGAKLVEQTAGTAGQEFSLDGSDALLGRDASRCRICVNDPFLNDVHAQLFQDKQQRWVIKDRGSLNGIWIRIPGKVLDPGTEFLMGGQRFRFDSL